MATGRIQRLVNAVRCLSLPGNRVPQEKSSVHESFVGIWAGGGVYGRWYDRAANHKHSSQDCRCQPRLGSATPYIKDIAVFALNTGLRIGEILTLTWEQVELEKNVLNVFAHKTHRIRQMPLNAEAQRVLESWALGRKNQFVFYNHETGKPFVDLKAGFALACRKAGLKGVTWHKLRHTFASRLLNRGVDIVTVQQLLGHSTVTVTMRYTHTNLDSRLQT